MSDAPADTSSETREGLVAPARLCGDLLLHEIDEARANRLAAVADQLPQGLAAAVGRAAGPESSEQRDELAAAFHDTFLGPRAAFVPVQSIHREGRYGGPTQQAVKALAETAGLSWQSEGARGAAIDHLGCLLLLWADIAERWPQGADHVVEHHLVWALAPLRDALRKAPAPYGELLEMVQALIRILGEDLLSRAEVSPGD